MAMGWWSVAAGAYAAALIAMAPATLADAALQGASDGRLRLADAEGTLWSGGGQIEIRDAGGRIGTAKRLAWRLRPAALLRARLAYEITLESGPRPFPFALSWSRIEFANADISLPAAALGLGVPRLAPLGLTGDMQIHITSLSVARDGMEGSGTLQWRGAGSVLTPISPLGDYEVRFNAAGPAVRAALSTLEGPLQLEGNGSWSNGAPPSFLAVARVPAQYREQLSPLLRLIGVERSAGSFEFSSNMPALRP
jgi:general secretion pathway protein N